MHPRVSIVITCFNYGAYVGEAIASALNQSRPPAEVIVVDDASDDACTKRALEKYENTGIRLIFNSSRCGVSEARNVGIKSANSPYVITLDADDRLDPLFIEKTVPFLHCLKADVVYTNTLLFGDANGPLNLPAFSVSQILKRNIVVSTALFRKTSWMAVGGYSPSLVYGLEDWDFWLSLLKQGARFHKVEADLFFYRKHGPSRTTIQKSRDTEMFGVIKSRHPELPIGSAFPKRASLQSSRIFRSIYSGLRTFFSNKPPSTVRGLGRPLKVQFFNPAGLKNFGDQLNVPLLSCLLGRPVSWAEPKNATHVCIGSMLEAFHPRITRVPRRPLPVLNVWGTGFIAAMGEHPKLKALADGFCRPVRALAVRGKLSLKRLAAIGIDTSRTALGDPGLLTSWIFDSKILAKRHTVGIIPHYIEKNDARLLELRDSLQGSTIIDVTEAVESVVSAIRQCDMILSSSLHGLVVADSYGIPNLHVQVSGKLTGGTYKFEDYYSTLEVSHKWLPIEAIPRQTKLLLDLVASSYMPDPERINDIQRKLLESLGHSD
jgi:glycosyltransferase involved in cell wall biosynthesis